MNIVDKHRLLLPSRVIMSIQNLSVKDKLTGEIITGSSYSSEWEGPMGIDFSNEVEIYDNGKLSLSIFLIEEMPFKSIPIDKVVAKFVKLVTTIVGWVEAVAVP